MVTNQKIYIEAFKLAREHLLLRGEGYPSWNDEKSDQENYDSILAYVKKQITLAYKFMDYQDEELLCKTVQLPRKS